MKSNPILCTGNDLPAVLSDIKARGGFVETMDTGVGGNAGYALSVFFGSGGSLGRRTEKVQTKLAPDGDNAETSLRESTTPTSIPKQPQNASSGTMQGGPDPTRTVKGVRQVAGQHAQEPSAAAGGETRAEKPKSVTDAPASISPSVGINTPTTKKRAVSAPRSNEQPGPEIRPNLLSVEDRLAALQAKLAASGQLRRSKPKTPAEHARLPHPDD